MSIKQEQEVEIECEIGHRLVFRNGYCFGGYLKMTELHDPNNDYLLSSDICPHSACQKNLEDGVLIAGLEGWGRLNDTELQDKIALLRETASKMLIAIDDQDAENALSTAEETFLRENGVTTRSTKHAEYLEGSNDITFNGKILYVLDL